MATKRLVIGEEADGVSLMIETEADKFNTFISYEWGIEEENVEFFKKLFPDFEVTLEEVY